MKNIKILLKKELFTLLIHPSFYIASFVFLFSTAAKFFLIDNFFLQSGSCDVRFFFASMPYIFILVIPTLTMGLWAGKNRTAADFEATLPFSDMEIVIAKWISSAAAVLFMLLLSFICPCLIAEFGSVDFGKVMISYFGIFSFSLSLLAFGQFISFISKSQATSFLITAVVLFISNSIHLLPLYFQLPNNIAVFTNYFSFAWHFDSSSQGIFDLRDMLFYFVTAFIFIYSTIFVMDRQKRNS